MNILINILLCFALVSIIFKIKRYKNELNTENLIQEKLKNIANKPSISLEEYNSILNLRTNN